MDLHVTGEKPVEQEIDDYIVFFNEERPAYSLNYLTPKQYREAHRMKCRIVSIFLGQLPSCNSSDVQCAALVLLNV